MNKYIQRETERERKKLIERGRKYKKGQEQFSILPASNHGLVVMMVWDEYLKNSTEENIGIISSLNNEKKKNFEFLLTPFVGRCTGLDGKSCWFDSGYWVLPVVL